MLKTKTIKTDKATLLVVECPKTYSLFHDEDWQLLGRILDITEDQSELIVESWIMPFPNGGTNEYYKDYVEGIFTKDFAIDSLYSLLKANEIYFENPLGKPPTREDLKGKPPEAHAEIRETMRKWHEAQSKVWDRDRTYLLIKEE